MKATLQVCIKYVEVETTRERTKRPSRNEWLKKDPPSLLRTVRAGPPTVVRQRACAPTASCDVSGHSSVLICHPPQTWQASGTARKAMHTELFAR